jgi:vacuolar protein sorting-associated protein 13D
MLEGLAAWVLKAYIGKYVNVNAHKLSVGLLSGIVELENVPLISEAFNDNDFPFELKFGYVGKIKLNISLNSLRYTPWILTAENLFMIIGPKNLTKTKSNDEQENNDQDKQEKLINLENKWCKEVEFLGIINSNGGEEQSKLFSIFGPMAYSLLQNLHVNLNNFHIRYEDDSNCFSIGAFIDSISIQNDNDLIKSYDSTEKNSTDKSFKSCEINNFSIYTDTKILFDSNLEIEKLFDLLVHDKITNLNENPTFNYLIQPTSLKSQVIRDTSAHPIRKRNKPRIKVISMLKEFHLNINTIHLKYFSYLLKSINIHKNKLMSRNLIRPSLVISSDLDPEVRKQTIRKWWQYLINSVRLQVKKPTMYDFLKWSSDINMYKKIYQNILKNRFLAQLKTNETVVQVVQEENQIQSQETNLETDLKLQQTRIESDWDFKRLIKLRRLIFENFIKSSTFKEYLVKSKQLTSNQSKSADTSNVSGGMYGYMSWRLANLKDYYFSKTPSPSIAEEVKQDEEEEKDPIQHNKVDDEVLALINASIENESLIKRDTLLASLEFKLDDASILLSNEKEEIAEFKFGKSTFLFEAMPRHDSFLFQMNLGSFYLHDCVSLNLNKTNLLKKNYFPIVVYPKTSDENQQLISEAFFQLTYEHNPFTILNRKKINGASLVIKSFGLDIIYNIGFIENFKNFFEKIQFYLKEANSVKIKCLSNLKNNKQTNSTNDNKETPLNLISASPIKNLILDLEINAPKIIFPQDFYVENSMVVIFDFGRFAFKNRETKNQKDKSVVLKKSKTESFFNEDDIDLEKSDLIRRNSDSKVTKVVFENNSDSDDEDEIYETPSSTPPPELEKVFVENLSKQISETDTTEQFVECKFYLTYDLHLNELQTVIGYLNSNNIQAHLSKGHSSMHFLEKFDILIQIDICKFKLKQQTRAENNVLTPLKIKISLNLLKIHIDDLKLIYIFKTIEDLQKIFQNNQKSVNKNIIHDAKPTSQFTSSNEFIESSYDNKEFETSLLTYISVSLNEIDMTISVNKVKNDNGLEEEFEKEDKLFTERKSNCELKIYNVNSELMSNINGNQLITFKIVGLLLIDARQIYGTDYQLLAASHNQVELDAKTGRIMDRIFKPRKSLNELDPKSMALNPLINIDLIVKNKANIKEYIVKSSFSTFDIILNPETISEMIMLFYSSYLNISSKPIINNNNDSNVVQEDEKVLETSIENESWNRLKINFEFSRLSVQLFKIENFDKANKIALFSLNGTSLEATILPEIKYQKMIVKIKGLKISNLKEALKLKSKQKSLFGIGLQNDNEFCSINDSDSSEVFKIVYNKSIETYLNKEISELKIQMASLCYLHSPEFIYDLECCFKDFKRFHAKTMEKLTEKAASLAIDMLKKGTTYLQNTIADIYERSSPTTTATFIKKGIKKRKSPKIKIKILLQTPVIALPMSNDSNLLLIAHLGHITINNNVANYELNEKINQFDDLLSSQDQNFNENNISESTKFEINLKNMRLFTIDLEKEKNYLKAEYERYKGFKSESHQNVFVIENYFQIYYEPKCSDKLIDETDVILSLDYLPKFSNSQSIDGGSVRVLSKINVCKIMLSKTQLEQVIKTLDNIVYDDCELNLVNKSKKNSESFNQLTSNNMMVFSPSKTILSKQTEQDHGDGGCSTPSTERLYASSFKTLYNKFSEQNEDLKSDLNIDVRFKIDKLQINFLADVEHPSQDIAELCFNEYELTIVKHEKYVKFINMTLKSLCLIDKLKKSNENLIEDKSVFLLKSFSSLNNSQIKHTCNKSKNNEYISSSLPNISSGSSYFKSYLNSSDYNNKNKPLNNFVEIAKFYEKLSGTLSTSLPSEIPKFSIKNEKTVNINQNPSTPPPSPSKLKREKNFPLIKSESMSNLNKEFNDSFNQNDSSFTEQTKESKKNNNKKCLGCIHQNMPLASIRLIFIDKKHPKFETKYLSVNRFYKIKFSDLQLNVNPETWIILLDMLGLGAKIYSLDLEKEENSDILNEKISNYKFVDKDHPYKDEENLEDKPSTSIEFEVKHFAIQLNKSVSTSHLSQIRVKNVMTFIETRYNYLKANGTLGSLEIYDISSHKGFYSDRFLTSGKQALEFELFKIGGPPDILCTREYDNSFKLRMSSVKYVHTQRFLSELTGYFQQFNQLQDALGRMRALSIGQKNISCIPQRGSRIKLDIQAQTPIVVSLLKLTFKYQK